MPFQHITGTRQEVMTPETALWRERIADWVKEAASEDEKKRAYGQLHLSLLTRPLALAHLPALWEAERQKHDRGLRVNGVVIGVYLAAILFCLVAPRFGSPSPHGVPFFIFFIQGIGGFFTYGNRMASRFRGLIYALIQHQNVEFTPLLIEALPLTVTSNSKMESLREPVMSALTRLLPRFVAADLPALNQRQRRILENQLSEYAKRLQSPKAAISPEEADFLRAIMATLTPALQPSPGDRKITQAIECLAMERHDPPQEPIARAQVREAARQTAIRLLVNS